MPREPFFMATATGGMKEQILYNGKCHRKQTTFPDVSSGEEKVKRRGKSPPFKQATA